MRGEIDMSLNSCQTGEEGREENQWGEETRLANDE